MILRRYGSRLHSVDLNFDSNALSEIGFRRNRHFSIDGEDFDSCYECVRIHELTAEAEGMVQGEAEQELLDRLERRIVELLEDLDEGHVLHVENRQGHDYPKTRYRTKNLVVDGENKLHFTHWVEPPLRIGIYRRVR